MNIAPSTSKKIKHKKFSAEEDARIMEEYEKNEKDFLTKLARELHRTERSIRERYNNYLKVENKEFTDEELELLEKKVQDYGRKWAIIRNFFPGLSANLLRDKYNSIGRPVFRTKHPNYVPLSERKEIKVVEKADNGTDLNQSILDNIDLGAFDFLQTPFVFPTAAPQISSVFMQRSEPAMNIVRSDSKQDDSNPVISDAPLFDGFESNDYEEYAITTTETSDF